MTALTVELPKTERRCENCACYFRVHHPVDVDKSQAFCRRDPPVAQQVAVDVPRMRTFAGKTEPVLGRDGKPVMERKLQIAYVFAMTEAHMCCFDGWRPLGTQPGDQWQQQWSSDAIIAAHNAHLGKSAWSPEEIIAAIKRWRAGPPLTPRAANDSASDRPDRTGGDPAPQKAN